MVSLAKWMLIAALVVEISRCEVFRTLPFMSGVVFGVVARPLMFGPGPTQKLSSVAFSYYNAHSKWDFRISLSKIRAF